MCIVAAALAAILMGLPTLRGGFVGGDDHRLVIDHVLVNRPSVEHALKLFTIVHRDLYQPLPLLMFSGEMAVAQSLNLFRSGPQGGAWLFHLTNIVLHALVSVAVFLTVRMLHRRSQPPGPGESDISEAMAIASLAALIFAIHPLNVETVAWVNGRMLLLSTLFALVGVLAFARWLDRGTKLDAVLTLACVVLSALSKVRVGLLLLLLLVALMHGDWRQRRFWPIWLAAGALTAAFAWINVGATSQADLFAEGAEHLLGPRAVRVLLALEHYFLHVVWPVGLTSYYPTPPVVCWSDPETIRAVFVNVVVIGLLGLTALRIPAARWGLAWFFLAIADTLPFVPARNVLAADRYMYLPFPGLLWAIVACGWHLRGALAPRQPVRAGLAVAGAVLAPVLIGLSWYTARWYDNPELKTLRVARVFPDVPRVWERYGWTLYSKDDYEGAIENARRELHHEIPAVQSGAWQLIGMSHFRQGRTDEAIAALQKALEIDPDNDLGSFRLGMVYEEMGRFSDAMTLYEACIRSATSHNPTLHRLARVYRELGRPDDARKMYQHELTNNPYEVSASLALADMDFQEGTPDSLLAAKRRLLELLDWMPENAAARVNLAHLYDSIGDAESARAQYAIAERHGFDSLDQAVFAHDFHERQGRVEPLRSMWAAYLERHPGDPAAMSLFAWTLVLLGDAESARRQIAAIGPPARELPMAQAAVALLAIEDGRDDMVRRLGGQLAVADLPTRHRVLRGLERFDSHQPGRAWTYYLTAVLLRANDQPEATQAFLDLFVQHCPTPTCLEAAKPVRAQEGDSSNP
jgi:tetratricopeptide (TPR) repeat protein